MQAQLVAAAQRRLQMLSRHPKETRRRRLLGWLQRRGHPWGVCRDVLQEVGL